MTEWIEQSITSAFAAIWSKVVGFFSLSFLDPFWHWALLGIAVVAIAWAIAWFFGGLFPFLRWLAGIVILGVIAALYAFSRGEKEARDFDKKKKRR